MEQFDILNRDGSHTGRTANKGTKLQNCQYYLGTHAYVYNSKIEFLLQKRAYSKSFQPGTWDICAEHTVAGETSVDCVRRGLQEELGLAVAEVGVPTRQMWDEHNHTVDVYFIKHDFKLDKLTLQAEEVAEAKTATRTEMLALIEQMHFRPAEYRDAMREKIENLDF
ncbi:MAG: NUDIX domain-containing protein [Defluviitaleaceae bacterium]|nr:NUDIX domain-containing protein [Defluviitaleaceae bacterium]